MTILIAIYLFLGALMWVAAVTAATKMTKSKGGLTSKQKLRAAVFAPLTLIGWPFILVIAAVSVVFDGDKP